MRRPLSHSPSSQLGEWDPSAKEFLERVGAQAPGALAALSVELSFTVACGMSKLYTGPCTVSAIIFA